MTSPAPGHDYVDEMVAALTGFHAPSTLESKALAYRLRRVAHRLEIEIKRELSPHDIELWELELLACLSRARPAQRLSAGQLMTQLQLTSGAVTNRVNRLERKGWVTREPDPGDRRSVVVTLTADGAKRAAHVFGTKTEAEGALLAALSPARRRRLNDDLRTLLISLEDPDGTSKTTRRPQP
ncbi:MarR family winged helix-turn-helix transcriptional regulator [Amycolatopsis sp. NPDC059027]|uniref:MarR family winged helix-turn-helix transcriptional regulator n=1 Tax=unclassified Amycolatopsis TaxID=2618356 RepID=UPI0036731CFA